MGLATYVVILLVRCSRSLIAGVEAANSPTLASELGLHVPQHPSPSAAASFSSSEQRQLRLKQTCWRRGSRPFQCRHRLARRRNLGRR
eukprot:8527073-Pyramimonas_sp.AAC.1